MAEVVFRSDIFDIRRLDVGLELLGEMAAGC